MPENTPTPDATILHRNLIRSLEDAAGLRTMLVQRTAERDALAVILAEAPHTLLCEADLPGVPCTCWKSNLPADALAARDADKWDEGFAAGNYGRNPYRIEREAATNLKENEV